MHIVNSILKEFSFSLTEIAPRHGTFRIEEAFVVAHRPQATSPRLLAGRSQKFYGISAICDVWGRLGAFSSFIACLTGGFYINKYTSILVVAACVGI